MDSFLKVTTPATTQDLTTIDRFRTATGVTTAQLSDDDLAALITQASGICADYLRMPLALESLTETFWQTGPRASTLIFLARRPIVEVAQVSEGGIQLVADTDYAMTGTGLRRLGRYWGCDVIVDYQAGYTLPPPGTLPMAAETACIELIKNLWSTSTRDNSLRRQRVEVPGVRTTENEWWIGDAGDPALPREVTDLLDLVPIPMVA